MTEDELSMMEIAFDRETKEIKAEFSRLLLRLQMSLEKHCKLEHVVNLLIYLDDENWLKQCSSIDSVFKNANKFCSFYNSKAVKLLINELGTEQDEENYLNYKRKFQKYCQKRVFYFPNGKSSVEVGKLAMKTDDSIEKLPLNEKKELEYEISRVFKGKKLVKLISEEHLSESSTTPSKPGPPSDATLPSGASSISTPRVTSSLTASSVSASTSHTSRPTTPSKAAASKPTRETFGVGTPSESSTTNSKTPSECSTHTTFSKAPSESSSTFTTSSKTLSKPNALRKKSLLIPTYQFERKFLHLNTEVSKLAT